MQNHLLTTETKTDQHDQNLLEKKEILDIRSSPGLAYQSYEAFTSDADQRAKAQ